MKGETSSPVEHSEQIEWPLCEKKTRRPAQQTAPPTTFVSNDAGRTFEYLIGQQRQQSMPHPATKSSANLKILWRQTLYSARFAESF
jgi:hypothetical protein